jgi:rod shape-determining protein MreC
MITVFGRPLRGPSALTRLVLLAMLSAGLMLLDHRSSHLKQIRAGLMVVVQPFQAVVAIPISLYQGLLELFSSSGSLREERDELIAEREQLMQRLQQLEALEAENAQLRAMLGSAKRVAERALTAELVNVGLEPFSRRLLLRRGDEDGAYTGQPVIDAHGIFGQLTQVGPQMSTVTLITDPGHAVPVLNQRSGLRAMVFGAGDSDSLSVPYLTAVSDIKEGDLLVSSGLGGTFPAGYPVAYVTRIENDPSEGFLRVEARPAARLNHGKQVLLIWPGQKSAAVATTERPAAEKPTPEPKR